MIADFFSVNLDTLQPLLCRIIEQSLPFGILQLIYWMSLKNQRKKIELSHHSPSRQHKLTHSLTNNKLSEPQRKKNDHLLAIFTGFRT